MPTLPRQIQTERQTKKTHDFETHKHLDELRYSFAQHDYSELKLEKHYVVIVFTFVSMRLWFGFIKYLIYQLFIVIKPYKFYISPNQTLL